jgi:hypothetical protein
VADKNYNVVLTASDETRAAFDSMRKNIEGVQAPLLSFQNLAVAAGATALVAMEKASIDAGDEMYILSQKTGIAVETLAGLELAGKMNGVSLDDMATGLKKLSTYMYEADKGGQKQIDTLRVLGITTRDPVQAMYQLADVISKMPDGMEKSALMTELMGKSATSLIPTFNGGKEALKGMIDEGMRLNPMSTEFANNANNFNDNLDRIQTRAKGSAMIIANELLPALNNTAEAILHTSSSAEIFKGTGQALAAMLTFTVEAVADTVFFFKDLGNTIGGVSAQIVAAVHGNFDEVHRIQVSMDEDHKTGLANLKAFKAEIEATNNAAATPAKAKTDDTVAAQLKALDARRAAQAELQKMNDASDKYDIEHAKQAYDRHVKAMDALAAKDSDYFQNLRNKVQDLDKSDIQRDKLAEQRELQALAVQREIMATDHDLSLGEQQQFEEARTNIIKLHQDIQTKDGQATFEKQLATAGTQFRAAFLIEKEYRTATALMGAHDAAVKAYDWGVTWGGPAGGAAMSALAYAATMAEVMSIQSASFGGGTGSSGAGGGGGGAPLTTPSPLAPQPAQTSAPAAARPIITINMGDSAYLPSSAVRDLIDRINVELGDGATLVTT